MFGDRWEVVLRVNEPTLWDCFILSVLSLSKWCGRNGDVRLASEVVSNGRGLRETCAAAKLSTLKLMKFRTKPWQHVTRMHPNIQSDLGEHK